MLQPFTKIKIIDGGEVGYIVGKRHADHMYPINTECKRLHLLESQFDVLIEGHLYCKGAQVISTTDKCNACGGIMRPDHKTTIVRHAGDRSCFLVVNNGLGVTSGNGEWCGCPLCFVPLRAIGVAVTIKRRNLPALRTDL